jgi:hypothetical protein
MKYIAILLTIALSFIFITPVFAADPPGLITTVEITGNNPLTGVQINGDNPGTGVFIDGQNPTTLVDIDGQNSILYINGHDINQTVGQAINGAVQSATPNSQWSGGSTGMLPPLANIQPELEVLAPGKYTQGRPGWLGYFSPKSNESPYVYKGSGCGMWGISDGYPDLWGRRQIAGIAPEFYLQKEKLNQTQIALVKVIGELKSGNDSIDSINTRLSANLDTLSGNVTDLSVIEEENLQYRIQTTKQIDNLYTIIIVMASCCIVVCIAIAIGFGILLKSRKPY